MPDEQPALYALKCGDRVFYDTVRGSREEVASLALGPCVPVGPWTNEELAAEDGYTVVRVKVVEVEEPDQSAALQRAIDKAAEESPQVFIKPGRYGDSNVRVSEVEEEG